MTEPAPGLNVAAELAELRGEMVAGFARLEGQLNLITQKQDTTAKDLDELEQLVTELESRRWPLGSMAAVSGGVSGAVAVVALLLGR